jgi:hypothetical protein
MPNLMLQTLLLYKKFNDILIQTDFKTLLFPFGTQDSVDSIETATSWTNEFISCHGARVFIFSEASMPALGRTYSPKTTRVPFPPEA